MESASKYFNPFIYICACVNVRVRVCMCVCVCVLRSVNKDNYIIGTDAILPHLRD